MIWPKQNNLRNIDLADYGLFLPCICVAAALGFSLSIMGPFFVIIAFVCLLYSILRLTMPPRILSAYVALCLIAGILSHYRAFPTSWQVAFLNEAILRQLVPVICFFAIAWASKAYFQRKLASHHRDIFSGELLILFLCFIVAPLVMLYDNVQYQTDSAESTILAAYGSLINNIVIGLFFVSGRLFYDRKIVRLFAAAFGLLVAATTHFLQFRVITASVLLILLGVPPRLVAVGVPVAFTAVYALDINGIHTTVGEDPNKAIRVAFVTDTIKSLIDTHGIGIGYGTESVRWIYNLPGLPKFTFMPNPTTIDQERLLELLSRGVHNSFAQAMLRTGVVGLILLTCAFFAAFPPPNLLWSMEAQASTLFITIFVACFVNPALESPLQLIGVGFVYGYLLALRAFGRRVESLRRSFSIHRAHTAHGPAVLEVS